MKTTEELKGMANAIRMLSVDAIEKANSGHPGMPMGCADFATVLFNEYLKFDPKNPKWPDRDRFVVSNGHGSMLLYSLFYLTGYEDCTIQEIENFRQLHSKTPGHPEYGYLKGIETTTGPLGQGIANAVGMALTERLLNAKFGDNVVDHKTYCIVGDGCLMEGISYEALGLAGHLNLNKLIVLFDDNEITIDGSTDIARTENIKMRMESINFNYLEADGHNFEEIRNVLTKAQTSDKPVFIALKTKIGFGCPTKEGKNTCHGSPIKGEDTKLTRERLKWKHDPFIIPENILKEWRKCGKKGRAKFKKWTENLEKSKDKKEFERLMKGDLPKDWKKSLDKFEKELFLEKPKEATRKSSGRVLEILTKEIPEMIGGSADLTGSVKTKTKAVSDIITAENYSGRYLNYGVREHAMAAIMNGMALHGGVIPYSGTFLVFADYMKPSIRLSAMMKQRIIYVLTHDSIGLGEDGPTHQPIEQLAMLRSIPNLNVFRPCDAQETLECYEIALENKDTPSAMVLTRQGLPFLANEYNPENYSAKGAYIYSDTALGIEPDAVIIATGSEVSLALGVKDELHKYGYAVRVVSAPCLDIFEKQPTEYKNKVLGGKKAVKVAIEAGCNFGWYKIIGKSGLFFGTKEDSFGMSAPYEDIFEEWGLTPEKIAPKIDSAVKDKRNKLRKQL